MRPRLMVTGSRDWTDEITIRDAMIAAMGFLNAAPDLIHGACRSGADVIAHKVAEAYHWEIEMYPADWATYGRAAGPMRNAEMLNTGINLVLAFQRDGSRGTGGAITLAREMHVPVWIWSTGPLEKPKWVADEFRSGL